jgi:putative flippase GtrA
MIQKLWSHKLIRFAVVGVINTVTDFTILNVLVIGLNMPVILGNIISVSFSVTVSYFLNRKIVFQGEHPITLTSYLKFFGVTGLSVIVIQSIVIYLLRAPLSHEFQNWGQGMTGTTGNFLIVHKRQLSVNVAKAIAVLCGLFWNYILYTKFVFKNKSKEEMEDTIL